MIFLSIDTGNKNSNSAKYTGTSQSITIPSQIDWDGASYNVTVIGQNAFRDNTTITSINIPKGVLEIDNYAFMDAVCFLQ